MTDYNIAIIGECMVELQKNDESLTQSFGGDTLNTAVYLSRLTKNQDIKVSYVSAIGNDPFSEEMLKTWQAEGVDTSLVLRLDNKMPGLYYIETDDTGERHFHYWRNDSAAKYMFDMPESQNLIDILSEYDAVYLSGITLAILTDAGREALFDLLQGFKNKGGKVFFDNNFRPKLWVSKPEAIATYKAMLNLTDTALLTFDDEQALFGDLFLEQCIDRTTAAGVREIIVKRGGKDCLVVQVGKTAQYVPPLQVPVRVDTTAAGDSFSAGYLAKRLTGGGAIESAKMGHTVAGSVIQFRGAIIPKEVTPALDEYKL